MKRLLLILLFSFFCGLVFSSDESYIYMKIDGIDGAWNKSLEGIDVNSGWIKVISFNYNLEIIEEEIKNDSFIVYKQPDKASIPLFLSLLKKTVIKEVIIYSEEGAYTGSGAYYYGPGLGSIIIRLKDVSLISISTLGNDKPYRGDKQHFELESQNFIISKERTLDSGDTYFLEEVKFSYKKIEWEITENKSGWDFEKGEEINPNESDIQNYSEY